MQPRIYTYKITFEEIPHWYWGVHKERRYNDGYMGSPVTHKWMWEFYTPKIQILEFFPDTEGGWKEACNLEKRLILPDLNNLLCLNEGCGGGMSLAAQRKASKIAHSDRDDSGKSINASINAKKGHEVKNEEGKSVHAIRMVQSVHRAKNEEGKSIQAVKLGKITHLLKNEEGKSIRAIEMVQKANEKKTEDGRSFNAVNAAKRRHLNLDQDGKSITARQLGRIGGPITASQLWVDPDHPELGAKSAGTLTRMQRARGYPSGRENRIRVE
jgi:hypothetical protein